MNQGVAEGVVSLERTTRRWEDVTSSAIMLKVVKVLENELFYVNAGGVKGVGGRECDRV